MSGQRKQEYEIYTSMSEELILEELKAMKHKFMAVGQLTAKHFNLIVLAPARQNGRRRNGGFVQLTGSITRQDDGNCIHIKTRSGVSFIIPMIMMVCFALVIGSVLLAGDWKPELLFPITFLIVFTAVLFCVRKKDGRVAENILRERFEGRDHVTEFCYTTRHTKKECGQFMKHDNMNDVYEYEWRQEKTFGALIIKNYKVPDFVHDFDGRQEWGFVVRFLENENSDGTFIHVQLVQTEKLPFIHNKSKIDMFWEKKLDAYGQ